MICFPARNSGPLPPPSQLKAAAWGEFPGWMEKGWLEWSWRVPGGPFLPASGAAELDPLCSGS